MCRWASVGQATYAHAMAKANQKHTNTHTHTSAYICTISDWGSDKHTTHRTPQKTEQTLFMIRERLKLLSLVLIALLLNYPCVLPQQLLLLLRAALRVYCSFFPAFIRRIEIEGSIHFSKGARKQQHLNNNTTMDPRNMSVVFYAKDLNQTKLGKWFLQSAMNSHMTHNNDATTAALHNLLRPLLSVCIQDNLIFVS